MANFVFSFTVCNDHSRISPCSSTGRHIRPLNICRVILYWYVHFVSIQFCLTLSHFLQWRVLLHALTSFYGFHSLPFFYFSKTFYYPTQYPGAAPWGLLLVSSKGSHVDDVPLPYYVKFATIVSGSEVPPPPPPPLWATCSGLAAHSFWLYGAMASFCHPYPNTIAPPLGMLLHNTGECRETDLSCTYLAFVGTIALWTSSWSSPFRAQLVWSPFSSFHHEYYRRRFG